MDDRWRWDDDEGNGSYVLDGPDNVWRARVEPGKPECIVRISLWGTDKYEGRLYTQGIVGLENACMFAGFVAGELLRRARPHAFLVT